MPDVLKDDPLIRERLVPVNGPTVIGELVEICPGRVIDVAVHSGTRTDAPVVVFCHGSGGNKDQWRLQWQSLAAEGYRLVAWDLLGHGGSDKPDRPAAYAWDELVADYLAVLKRFGGERNVLVAHSFGTGLTLSALVRLQQQGAVRGIDAVLLLGTLLTRPQIKGGLMGLPVWILTLIRPWLAKGFRERAWHPTADARLVDYEEKITENNRLYVFKALSTHARWPTLAELDGLRSLDLPISIMAGATDGLTPPASGKALAEHLSSAHFELLADCGHQLMLEQPDAVLNNLKTLLVTAQRTALYP